MSLEERANAVGPKAYKRAADIYWQALDVQAQNALTGDKSDADADDAERATNILEGRFPGIKDVGQLGPEEWASARNPNVKLPHQKKKRSKPPSGGGGSGGAAPPASPRSGRRRASSPSRPKGGARHRRSRATALGAGYLLGRRSAIEQTGLPGGARTITSTTLATLGGIVALAIIYNLLTARRAGPLFLTSIGGFLDRLVRPDTDPLAPLGRRVNHARTDTSGVQDPIGATPSPALETVGALAAATAAGSLSSVAKSVNSNRATTHGGRPRTQPIGKRRLPHPGKRRLYAHPDRLLR
jgi:hypothetical protein